MCARCRGDVKRPLRAVAVGRDQSEEGDSSVSDELSIAELDSQHCVELPTRNQMRHHRFMRRRSFRHFSSCGCSCGGGFNTFGFNRGFDRGFNGGFGGFGFNRGFGGFGGFGGASNFNSTFQSNFNPQFGFGGGNISSFNSNFNNSNQFAFGGF